MDHVLRERTVRGKCTSTVGGDDSIHEVPEYAIPKLSVVAYM